MINMKADSLHMGKVFSSGGDVHYVLPHFQREYAWEKKDWLTLLKDIFNIYEIYDPQKVLEHFMGALVVINDGTQSGTVPVFRLVDGQQRLTTISLLLAALGHLIQDDPEHKVLYRKIRGHLVNQYEEGSILYYKLLPTLKYGDRESYTAIINGAPPPANVESQIPTAYAFLFQQLETRYRNGQFDPNQLFNVLMTSLQVVFINLNGSERPYEIFESLNYKGKSLTQADLVRNYIAMKLPPERQEEAFIQLWSPIEETLLEKRTVGRSRLGELTAFLRHYFAYLYGVLVNKDHVYSRFRDRGEEMSVAAFEAELKTLKRFAGYYDRLLRPRQEPDADIRNQLHRLNILESSTAYPFLIFMYEQWQAGEINRDAFLAGLRTLETYMVRRFLARESTNYLNKMFPTLARDVDVSQFNASLRQVLGSKNEPSDTRLRQSAETVKLYDRTSYTRQKLGLIYNTINQHLSAGSGAYTVLDNDPTIEHIMPQTLTESWKQHLGDNWIQDYELLHTLGNLTLVTQSWNSQLSNALYETKREKFAAHGFLLNQAYFSGPEAPPQWHGETIRARAQWLMEKMTAIWPQLGETAGGWEEKPKALTIIGETFPLQSWRDMLRVTADFVAQWHDGQFDEKIVAQLPNYFSKEPFASASHQLPNGWWININHNANWIKQTCETIIEASGIPEDEYELELW
jgi:uncharacterized protein with ParB-like and HNH nuclease domain